MKKNENSEEEDEDEIPTDQEVNRMLARGEDEYKKFQEMDKKRYEVDRKVFPNFSTNYNYRLLSEAEVPAWVKTVVKKKF